MLAYRHGFHAGSHADVLKHTVLLQLLMYLQQKDKAICCVDTHAGAPQYDLGGSFASKTAEFETGIARLWAAEKLPAVLRQYIDAVRTLNPDGKLRHYPGSSLLMQQHLRKQDRLFLFEKHPSEIEVLKQHYEAEPGNARVSAGDGFVGVQALLPPVSRRALVLIDPSYEQMQDYRRVLTTVRDALKRFDSGTYAVWYPQIDRKEARELADKLKALCPGAWLHFRLTVSAPRGDGIGMTGSGMVVLNPPWKLPETLRELLPALVKHLGQDHRAAYLLEQNID